MHQDKRDENLTPEEIEVSKIISETSIALEDLDKQIENLLPDKPLVYQPGGTKNDRPLGTKIKNKTELREQQERLRTVAEERIEKASEKNNDAVKSKIKNAVKDWKDNNYKDMFAKKQREKDISRSQEYAAFLKTKQDRKELVSEPELTNSINPSQPKQPAAEPSAGEIFMRSLNFYKEKTVEDDFTPNKDDITREDGIEPFIDRD